MIEPIDTVTLQDCQRKGRDFILIDTLPLGIFAEGHLPGAINLPSDDILEQAPKRLPDRDATLVVYCASAACKRAGPAAGRLEQLGYTRLFHYDAGKKGWLAEGLTLEGPR
ncbi:rhodanese-like domain-containing protein [Marinobacter sp. C2H3]|uniref:rhodanese-like domain-containing protein n=1 Tax=Marinobacter sp. C2H3 TaxID=3119003 RepID=UPI00300EB37B